MSNLVSAAAELVECEETIEQGIQTFVEVGQALMRIRNGKLYRAAGFKTFEDYCKRRWSFTRQYASLVIDAAEAARNLKMSTMVDILPASERQARPLTRLGPPQQREAWENAVTSAGGAQPTGRQVEAAARQFKPSVSGDGGNIVQLHEYRGVPDPNEQAAHFFSNLEKAAQILRQMKQLDPHASDYEAACQKINRWWTKHQRRKRSAA